MWDRKRRKYALQAGGSHWKCRIHWFQAEEFLQKHGYFSKEEPLVGRVSGDFSSLQATRSLLNALSHAAFDRRAQSFVIDETLAKVVSYRDWEVGTSLDWRNPLTGVIERYRLDCVFDVWHGMPAFGWVAEEGGFPLLLFRGTDFSLNSERGWASLISDLDPAGPGFTAFMKARSELQRWLKQVAQPGIRAKVIGFSLGGALAAYTFLYERAWVSEAVIFNPPGCSEAVFQDWEKLSSKERQGLTVYVNRGDPVSKVGRLWGSPYQLAVFPLPKPLRAHTLFLSGERRFICSPIDLIQENKRRS